MRLNLQLFAYTGNSIVDYLKSTGQDSSFSSRKKIAENLGIKNYTGTASQNTQMLNTLRSGSGSKTSTNKSTTSNTTTKNKNTTTTTTKNTNKNATTTTTSKNTTTNKNTNKNSTTSNNKTTNTTNSAIKGVDESTYNTMTSQYTQSEGLKEKYKDADDKYDAYEALASNKNIISQDTWDIINSSFVVPEAVTQADAWLTSRREQIQSGKTSYTDQIQGLMDKILNREDFEYDVDKDTLFQQALASAMGSGKTAMQDTIGQASALTGGYGSTYATSAGNQAYNAYIEDAYNNLPEYYQMALQAYQMEGQEMYNQLDMLNTADANEWNRLVEGYNVTADYRNQTYNEAYTTYQNSITNAFNSANLQLSEHDQLVTNAYNLYNVAKDSADTLYAQEYQAWNNKVTQATSIAQMQNSDYWSRTNFDEGVRQYNTDNEYRYTALAQDDEHWKGDNEYKYDALDEEKRQYNTDNTYRNTNYKITTGDTNMDGVLSASESAALNTNYGYDSNGKVVVTGTKDKTGNNSTTQKLSNGASATNMSTYKQKALQEYNKGGDEAVDTYVDSLGLNDDEKAEIGSYIYGDGKDTTGHGKLPLSQRTFTKTKDTINWGWGVDNNDVVKDQYGNTYKISEIKSQLKSEGVDSKVIDEILKGLTSIGKDKSYTYSSK